MNTRHHGATLHATDSLEGAVTRCEHWYNRSIDAEALTEQLKKNAMTGDNHHAPSTCCQPARLLQHLHVQRVKRPPPAAAQSIVMTLLTPAITRCKQAATAPQAPMFLLLTVATAAKKLPELGHHHDSDMYRSKAPVHVRGMTCRAKQD